MTLATGRLGIMIEGQEGLDWRRWRTLCRDVESLGFASLWRSDHFHSLLDGGKASGIETWVSLGLAAEWTKHLELGPLVSAMTFRPPGLLARMASTVNELAPGRITVGVGAGWNQSDYTLLGVPFGTIKERMDALENGIERLKEAWATHGQIPLLVGGAGPKRTLRIVAAHANEWNFTKLDPPSYRERADLLNHYCDAIGRDHDEIRHSLMIPFVVGRDSNELKSRAARMTQVDKRLAGLNPDQAVEMVRRNWVAGTPEEIGKRLQQYVDAGVSRFMLAHLLVDDSDALELIADRVLPGLS
jgi:alkanesulfonate monooxygenase SsuD/methylene tetrahydromethanopterin reductase-like flavin-dependent oxidoreductase (luciferase family)